MTAALTRWRLDPRQEADVQLALGLLFPASAGLALYGWRCLGVWALIALGALTAGGLLGRLRTWTATPRRLSLVVQSAVLALFCPATLFDSDHTVFDADARWPLLLAVGVTLATADWAIRAAGTRRVHPAVLTATLLTFGAAGLVENRFVLPPQHLGTGDLLDSHTADRPVATAEPWMDWPGGAARVLVTSPAERPLQDFLHGKPPPGRTNQTVTRLISDDLPPLEDLVVGGHPTPLGRGSVVALLTGGLFLVYRKLTPLRVPAFALAACYATLVVLPLPAGVGGGGTRRWLFERDPRVGWAAGMTLVHYLLIAGAVPLTATFLLPQPGVRPRGRWMAAAFALTFGATAAIATVFVSVSGGAILALLVTQMLWPRRRRNDSVTPTPGSRGLPAEPTAPAVASGHLFTS